MKAYSLCLVTEQLGPTSLFTYFDEVAQIDPFELFRGSWCNTPVFKILKLITLNGLSLIFMHNVIYKNFLAKLTNYLFRPGNVR